MEIGISTASLFVKRLTEEALDEIGNLGVQTAEVFLATFSEYTAEFGKILENKRRVRVHSVHALTSQYEPQLFSLGSRAYTDSVNILKNVLSVGQTIGARYYTFHGASRLKNVKYSYDYAELGEKVNALQKICGEYGITLTYENVHWSHFNEPEFYARLSPYLDIDATCLDIKQARLMGRGIDEYIAVMGDGIKTVHLSDYDLTGRTVLPGKGETNFADLFRKLKDAGVNAPCIIEAYPSDFNHISELKHSYDYLTECLMKA